MTALIQLSPRFLESYTTLKGYLEQESLYRPEVEFLVKEFEAPIHKYSHARLLNALHSAQRIHKIFAADAQNDLDLCKKLEDCVDKIWSWNDGLPVDPSLEEGLVDQFMLAPSPVENPKTVIVTSLMARHSTEYLFEQMVHTGREFDIKFQDTAWDHIFYNHGLDKESLHAAGKVDAAKFEWSEKAYLLRDARDATDDFRMSIYEDKEVYNPAALIYREKAMNGDDYFTLTVLPSPQDAEVDGINYDDYLDFFFQSCDQPWDEIRAAQDILIEKLDAAKEVRITNSDGTDITYDIEGFTFENSTTEHNIPGSEVFSSAKIDGVNGVIVAKGKFGYEGGIMENITLVVKDGYITDESFAEKGNDHFWKILGTDEGSRYFGEVALGTHPWIKRHLVNGLLVEKIGGSTHSAIGDSYNLKTANTFNGNKSKVHWDITTMLYGKDGKVIVDGEVIQDNGIFLDPKLAVFNDGWMALPEDKRPERWVKLYNDNKARIVAGLPPLDNGAPKQTLNSENLTI